MPVAAGRSGLKRSIKYFAIVLAAAFSYVLLDFAFDLRPPGVHSSYQFNVSDLSLDQARILRQDNLSVLLIRRSDRTITALRQDLAGLQDPGSQRSRQPEFAANLLRSSHPEYFVSYAIGTDFGCGLELGESSVKEICGRARYDFAGRALQGDNKFLNLAVPDYTFTNNFNTLTIRP